MLKKERKEQMLEQDGMGISYITFVKRIIFLWESCHDFCKCLLTEGALFSKVEDSCDCRWPEHYLLNPKVCFVSSGWQHQTFWHQKSKPQAYLVLFVKQTTVQTIKDYCMEEGEVVFPMARWWFDWLHKYWNKTTMGTTHTFCFPIPFKFTCTDNKYCPSTYNLDAYSIIKPI